MTTKAARQLLAAVVLCGVGLGGVLVWRGGGRTTAPLSVGGGQGFAAVASTQSVARAVSGSTGVGAAPSHLVSTSAPAGSPVTSRDSPDVLALVAKAVQANVGVKMGDVPRLNPGDVRALAELFERTDQLQTRYKILQVMVFGHAPEAVPLLTNLLVTTYGHTTLTREEVPGILWLPCVLGVSAREDDGAMQFLLAGTELGFWERMGSWRVQGEPPRDNSWAMRERCLRGLVISGRAEGLALLEHLKEHPERGAELDVSGGAVDSAFFVYLIKEHGLQAAFDWDMYKKMGLFSWWREATEEGREWVEWRAKVNQFRSQMPP